MYAQEEEQQTYTQRYVRPIMYCMQPCPEIFKQVNMKSIDTLHLYVDVKNSSTNLFIPDAVKDIVETGRKLKSKLESSIFQSIIVTASNWINFCKQNNLKYKIIFCNDKGGSTYHKEINKLYKANRKITNVILEHYKEEIEVTKYQNWKLAEIICNKLNDVHFINLDFLESDFIPYYLVTRYYKENNNILHVLSSNDKDHFQYLNLPNTLMFSRKAGTTVIYDNKSYLNRFIKIKDLSTNKQAEWIKIMSEIDLQYINVVMALCGDVSDNVKGLYKIGEKMAAKMIVEKEVVDKLIGPIEEAEKRVMNGGKLLIEDAIPLSKLSKQWVQAIQENDVVTAAFKQISYEALINWLEKRDTLPKKEHLDKIHDNINKEYEMDENRESTIVDTIQRLEDCVLTEENLYPIFN
jgi:5'-3' exonuclease